MPGGGGKVRLPSSGATLDRSTVMRLLQTSGEDPYTKAPLRPTELAPDLPLRAKIQAWAATHQAQP